MFADNAVDSMGRDKTKHISCGYVGNEDNCPNDCGRCAMFGLLTLFGVFKAFSKISLIVSLCIMVPF